MILLAWDRVLVARDEVAPRGGLNWRALAAVAVPAALYFAVRAQTGAFTPASAPSYYQLSFAPAFVARNLFEYADRAATVGAIALLVAAAVCRRMPAIDRSRLPLIAACAVWSVGGYALTLFLPIRSSLYAVFPSVGVAIAVAATVDDMRSRAVLPSRQSLRLAVAFGAIVVAMVPAYRARNGRAVRLRSGRDVQAWIDPPPGDWRLAGLQPPRPHEVALTFAVERGRVFKQRP